MSFQFQKKMGETLRSGGIRGPINDMLLYGGLLNLKPIQVWARYLKKYLNTRYLGTCSPEDTRCTVHNTIHKCSKIQVTRSKCIYDTARP